jgi:hypothetical protein
MKAIRLIALGLLALFSGGCVFWDIRDEVRASNAHIERVQEGLSATQGAIDQTNASIGQTNAAIDQTNAAIDQTHAAIDQANAKLRDVEGGLARLDTTNSSLKEVDERLAILRSIQDSLAHVDVHLASLRKTIGRIDHMIPFLDLGSDEAPAEPAPVAAAPAPPEGAAAPEPGEAAAGAPSKDDAAAKRDAIIGSWVSQYPDRATALVVLEDGHYIWQIAQAGGGWTTESGTWKRDGKQLRLTGDPSGPDSSGGPGRAAPAAAPRGNAPAPPPPPAERTFEIISRSARALTLRASDGRLMIFTKP